MRSSYTFLFIFICSVLSIHASPQSKGILHFVDSNYVVLTDVPLQLTPFKNMKPSKLSKKEIREIETLANERIDEHNNPPKGEPIKMGIIKERNYKIQLVPVINSKGEKEVWVNCLCEPDDDWRKKITHVFDGGTCFFSLKINLTTGKCYDFVINGEA
jgi:hypothetical protein